MDRARLEIMTLADAAIRKYGGAKKAEVYFTFSCKACGVRCTFNDPNILWEVGECHACGAKTVVERAGFALHISTEGKLPVTPSARSRSGESDDAA